MSFDEQKAHTFIGYCGITNIDQLNRRGEISFIVETGRTRNKKLYREDLLSTFYMLSCHSFENLNLHKLYTETYAFRKYHIQLLEEFGLYHEGVLRDHKFIRNKYWNSIIHSMLETEWPQAKERLENEFGK
jgi:RimJ/RimL family protein N-acetyltransferase